jgi:hypothetical protein
MPKGIKQVSAGGACDSFVADAVNQIPEGSETVLGGLADAIPPHRAGKYIVKGGGGADLMTLGAPNAGDSVAGGDDGKEILVISQQASAHTITFTGGTAQDGAGHTTTATFAAQLGASIWLSAYQGKWVVILLQGVTMTA